MCFIIDIVKHNTMAHDNTIVSGLLSVNPVLLSHQQQEKWTRKMTCVKLMRLILYMELKFFTWMSPHAPSLQCPCALTVYSKVESSKVVKGTISRICLLRFVSTTFKVGPSSLAERHQKRSPAGESQPQIDSRVGTSFVRFGVSPRHCRRFLLCMLTIWHLVPPHALHTEREAGGYRLPKGWHPEESRTK